MHLPRRSVIPSVVMALACSAALSSVLANRETDPRQDEAKPFTHAKHVPGAWLDPFVVERQRDCRGCHDYGQSETRDPQIVCTRCHFTDETNRYEFSIEVDDESFRSSLQSLRSAGSLFQHGNHLVLECRECHAVGGSNIEAPILMPKTGGLAFCQECHVGSKPRQDSLHFMQTQRDGTPITQAYKDAARAKLPLSLVASLNGTPSMGPNRPGERNVGPFRHDDHIRVSNASAVTTLRDLHSPTTGTEASRAGNCAACHGPMFDAQAGLGSKDKLVPFEQAPASCGACHISDEGRTPLAFAFEHGTRTGRTAATFSHAVHLNLEQPTGGFVKSSESGHAAIESEGCGACHVPGQNGAEEFALKGALADERSFQGCQSCHETAAWAPAEHGAWWTHRDHGSWQACASCHDLSNADFTDNRVLVEVSREPPARFRIESQEHPHISVRAGETIETSCAECHRQPVKELPSRIREARFQHGTHLPPNAGPEACAGCHDAALSAAETSASIGLPAPRNSSVTPNSPTTPGSPITYDVTACVACHLGSAPLPVGTDEGDAGKSMTRNVPEFSHAGHVGKLLTDGTAVGCTSCHDAGLATAQKAEGEGMSAVGTRASALDCSMCHSHAPHLPADAARAPSTGQGITAAEVAACALCHTGGLPVAGTRTEWPTAHIVDLVGNLGQFHPAAGSSDGACSNCHVNGERLISSTVVASGSRVFARRGFYEEPQTRTMKPAIHRGGTRNALVDVKCFACHWTNTLGDSAGEGSAPTNPERKYNRQKLGDDLRNYPGGASAASNR